MAEFNATNYQASRVDEPAAKLDVSEQHGRVRRLYDSITLSAEFSLNDTILAGVLPANARIIDARFIAPSDGTTGIYTMGWQSNGTDAADADGIFAGASLDTGAGAVDAKMAGTVAGWNKKFAAVETTLLLTVTEATTASDGDTLEWEIEYVVD